MINLVSFSSVFSGFFLLHIGLEEHKAEKSSKKKAVSKIVGGIALVFFGIIIKNYFKNQFYELKQKIFLDKASFGMKEIFTFPEIEKNLSENNFLPWNEKFSDHPGFINQIKPENMKEKIMWGITPENVPFIALKVIENCKERIFSLFQSSENPTYLIRDSELGRKVVGFSYGQRVLARLFKDGKIQCATWDFLSNKAFDFQYHLKLPSNCS